MLEEDTVNISFDRYEKLLIEIYQNSSPTLSDLLCKKIGLLLLETDYEIDNHPILKFKIIDKEKWFLSKIKFGI